MDSGELCLADRYRNSTLHSGKRYMHIIGNSVKKRNTHAEFITAWAFSLRCLRHVLNIILCLSVIHFGINTAFDFHKFIVRTVLLYRIIGKYGDFIAEFTA